MPRRAEGGCTANPNLGHKTGVCWSLLVLLLSVLSGAHCRTSAVDGPTSTPTATAISTFRTNTSAALDPTSREGGLAYLLATPTPTPIEHALPVDQIKPNSSAGVAEGERITADDDDRGAQDAGASWGPTAAPATATATATPLPVSISTPTPNPEPTPGVTMPGIDQDATGMGLNSSVGGGADLTAEAEDDAGAAGGEEGEEEQKVTSQTYSPEPTPTGTPAGVAADPGGTPAPTLPAAATPTPTPTAGREDGLGEASDKWNVLFGPELELELEQVASPGFSTIRNRIAVANVENGIGSIVGKVSFSWCHNKEERFAENVPPSVLVVVDLPECNFGWGGSNDQDHCAYQISNGALLANRKDTSCESVQHVYDPMLAVQSASPSSGLDYILEELMGIATDKCDSTQNLDKLMQCPAGSLSRIYGTSMMYYDNSLGIHNEFIGRSFLVVNSNLTTSPSGDTSYDLSCSKIVFWENCAMTEKNALMDFKRSLPTPQLLPSWTERSDMCEDFFGVTCNSGGHVIAVELPYSNNQEMITHFSKIATASLPASLLADTTQFPALEGTIPSSFSELDHLKTLDLSSQLISGEIPSSLGTISGLESLRLGGNVLSGSLPATFAGLTALKELNLAGNNLTGEVSEELLTELESLEQLDLSGNEGLCGKFQTDFETLVVVMQPCNNSESDSGLGPGSDSPAPFHESTLFMALLGTVGPALLLLSLSISCFAFVLYRRRHRSAQSRRQSGAGGALATAGTPPDNKTGQGLQLSGVRVDVHAETAKTPTHRQLAKVVLTSSAGSPMSHLSLTPKKVYLTLSPSAASGSPAVPSTPALKTRCPSGFSPLDYACLPPDQLVVEDDDNILGSGGYGVVYKATYYSEPSAEGLPAAVKVISNSDYDDAHASKWKTFKDEVEMLSMFQGNDCIVQVHSYCLDFPRAYIAYEYLPNNTLARRIHSQTVRQSYLQILQIGYGIVEGLHALHVQNVVHRDLKPDNILLDAHMRPILTDFGISRKKDAKASALSTANNLGTWAYMAPEQFQGRVCEKSDIYALGLILWECWTLRRPWELEDERDVWGMVFCILNEDKRPEIPDDCPKGLSELLKECWATDPKLRPTALDLKSRIWKIMTVQSRRKMPTPKKPKAVEEEEDEAAGASGRGSGSGSGESFGDQTQGGSTLMRSASGEGGPGCGSSGDDAMGEARPAKGSGREDMQAIPEESEIHG